MNHADPILGQLSNQGVATSEPTTARAVTCDPESWVERHGDLLFRYAMARVRDRELAEELVQESLLSALKGVAGFQGTSSEQTWLVGILKHKLLDFLRARRRAVARDGTIDPDQAVDGAFAPDGHWKRCPGKWLPDAAQMMERQEFWVAFRGCLDKLPTRVGQAFSLACVDEMDSAEVCKALGLTASNFHVMLHRARLRLRQCLENTWFAMDIKQ